MEEADWWICDCSGTRLCCQCTFDEPQDFIMYGICAGIGLVCALLSIKFHNFMLIASSSVFGAMAAGSSIFYLQPYKNGMIHVAL